MATVVLSDGKLVKTPSAALTPFCQFAYDAEDVDLLIPYVRWHCRRAAEDKDSATGLPWDGAGGGWQGLRQGALCMRALAEHAESFPKEVLMSLGKETLLESLLKGALEAKSTGFLNTFLHRTEEKAAVLVTSALMPPKSDTSAEGGGGGGGGGITEMSTADVLPPPVVKAPVTSSSPQWQGSSPWMGEEVSLESKITMKSWIVEGEKSLQCRGNNPRHNPSFRHRNHLVSSLVSH